VSDNRDVDVQSAIRIEGLEHPVAGVLPSLANLQRKPQCIRVGLPASRRILNVQIWRQEQLLAVLCIFDGRRRYRRNDPASIWPCGGRPVIQDKIPLVAHIHIGPLRSLGDGGSCTHRKESGLEHTLASERSIDPVHRVLRALRFSLNGIVTTSAFALPGCQLSAHQLAVALHHCASLSRLESRRATCRRKSGHLDDCQDARDGCGEDAYG